MFAYLVTYTNKNDGSVVKELYGKRSTLTGSFLKLASQFEGTSLSSKNISRAVRYAYQYKNEADISYPLIDSLIRRSNKLESKYLCECKIVEITLYNYSEYIFDKIKFEGDEE